jgi:hypothetical protein
MALTQGFQNLLKAVAIIAIVGGIGFYVNKNNYFGMLDTHVPTTAAVNVPDAGQPVQGPEGTAVAAEPQREEEIPVKARKHARPVVASEPEVTPYPPPKSPDPVFPRPEPAKHDNAINALKGMDKL